MNVHGRKEAIPRRKRRVVLGPVWVVFIVALLALGRATWRRQQTTVRWS